MYFFYKYFFSKDDGLEVYEQAKEWQILNQVIPVLDSSMFTLANCLNKFHSELTGFARGALL